MKEIMVDNARTLYSEAVTYLAEKKAQLFAYNKISPPCIPVETASALKHSVKMAVVIHSFYFYSISLL